MLEIFDVLAHVFHFDLNVIVFDILLRRPRHQPQRSLVHVECLGVLASCVRFLSGRFGSRIYGLAVLPETELLYV